MTTTADAPPRRRPALLATLRELYVIVLRMQLTPLRTLGVAALGAIAILLGLLTGRDDDPLQATVEMIADYGLTVAIPLCILWLATSSVGDLVDDGLLVYLWLKPIGRWQLPGASILATASVVLALVVVPLVIATVVAGTPELVLDVVAACVLATLAYAALFVALGLWLRRALWWGLAYLLVWENGVARASEGASRLSVGGYARSVLARLSDVELELGGRPLVLSLVVLVVVAIGGWLAATYRYRRAEIA
jgi:ABC-2 type transport system permease protein